MNCLFVIDVQNGFVTEKTKHVVPRIISLMESFNGMIIATKFINVEKSPFQQIMHWYGLRSSPETDVVKDIAKHANFIVEKAIYSACVEDVKNLLTKNKIDEAYVAGIDTDCCVLKTAIDLFEIGISPIVLADYCASNGGERSHMAGITVLERNIGRQQIIFGRWKQAEVEL